MSYYNLAIIGNGYDLHYDLPTKYENFYDMLKNAYTKKKDDFLLENNKNETSSVTNFYDTVQMHKENFFLKYFLSYNEIFKTWSSFEDELLNILIQFNDILNEISKNASYVYVNSNNKFIYNFKEVKNVLKIVNDCKLYSYIYKSNYGTVINKIDLKIKGDSTDHLYIMNKIDKFVNEFPYLLYSELEDFSCLFHDYIKTFVHVPEKQKFLEENKIQNFVIYNYTEIIDKYLKEEFCHIHGSIGKNNIVFGVDSKYKDLNRFGMFFKRIQRVSKKTSIPQYSIIRNSERIVIIGHSLSEADDDSLKLFLNPKNSYAAIDVYYYENDKFSLFSLANNLTRILGEEKFDMLYNYNILKFIPF